MCLLSLLRGKDAMKRTKAGSVVKIAGTIVGVFIVTAVRPLAAKATEDFTVTKVEPAEAQLGDQIKVTIPNLEHWLTANEKSPAKPDLTKCVLYLDDTLMTGVSARWHEHDNLVFVLERPKKSGDEAEKGREAWATFLAKSGTPSRFRKVVPVSVGYGSQAPLDTTAKLQFKVIPLDWVFWVSLVAFALFLGLFCFLASVTNLIRDPGPNPQDVDEVGNIPLSPMGWLEWIRKSSRLTRKPFSLALTQMAFWTLLTIGSYLFLWLITQDRDILPGSVLILLGISVGTALSAVIVEHGKRGATLSLEAQKHSLDESIQALKGRLAAGVIPPPTPEEKDSILKQIESKNASLKEIEGKLASTRPTADIPLSDGFLPDILSDGEGISLHRFQIAIWTIVLGIVFVASVYNRLSMPVFSETLLALMGISGATYVGFKFPETPKKE
jgi:hypothetical protein